MANNSSENGVIEYRRRLVASLLVRFPTIRQREMQYQIGGKVQNADTGKPYCLGTINNDIKEIKKDWRERAAQDYDGWVAQELAGLDELEAEAWNLKKLDIVIRCKERRAKLLGLDQPDKWKLIGAGDKGQLLVSFVDSNVKSEDV